jgi:hypothetical protein
MAFTIQPAEGREFFDRDEELKDILTTLRDLNSTLGFALYGKRRMGKTSLFKETRRRLLEEDKNLVCIYFSIWDLIEKSITEFVREFGLAIIEEYRSHLSLPHKAKDFLNLPLNFIRNVLSGLKLSIEIQDSLTLILSFERDKRTEPGKLIDEIFSLPERLAKETKKKSILFLDEFGDIVDLKMNGKKVGDAIIKKTRTISEGYKRTSLNISGSTRKTMESAVLSSTSAFYRQFIVKEIGPFSKEATKELMDKNLTNANLSQEGLNLLYEFTAGIPFYVQFLGRLLDKYSVESIQEKDVKRAIDEFLSQEGDLVFKEEFQSLSDKERLIVTVMATKDLSLFSEISNALGEQITNLGRYLVYLEEKDIIQKEQRGLYIFTDPIFKKWLAQKF